jgi:hypothetical protein
MESTADAVTLPTANPSPLIILRDLVLLNKVRAYSDVTMLSVVARESECFLFGVHSTERI